MQSIDAVGIFFYSVNTNRHLYLMRNDVKYQGYWAMPGGKIEKKESLLDAIIRECQEELGFMPPYLKLIPLEKFTAENEIFIYNTFYCIVENEFHPILNHEHIGYAWIDASVVPKPLHPGFRATLNVEDISKRIETLKDLYITKQ